LIQTSSEFSWQLTSYTFDKSPEVCMLTNNTVIL